VEDAAFIVHLRNSDDAKGKVGDSATDVASQEAWLSRYFESKGDYYFLVETLTAIPVGTIGIYDATDSDAELGRWIILPGVRGGVPSLLLTIDLAFRQMGFRQLRATTVSTNDRSDSLLRWAGFEKIRVENAARMIGGESVDIRHYLLSPEVWHGTRSLLLPAAAQREAHLKKMGEGAHEFLA